MKILLSTIGMGLLLVSCAKQADTTAAGTDSQAKPAANTAMEKPSEADALWTTYSQAVLDKAKTENKYILLDFTGSDWCGWCIKLNSEVFSQPEFITYAKDNLICVEVDFPQRKKISAEQKKINEELANTMGVRGFPTIFILDPNGKVVGKTGYKQGGAEAYVKHIKEIISSK